MALSFEEGSGCEIRPCYSSAEVLRAQRQTRSIDYGGGFLDFNGAADVNHHRLRGMEWKAPKGG
jgi:hypothetical protein